ncbi:hypothetical protein [Deinococcus arenicola]|uniref:Carboxypeptidase regulatory-like domain-containing protein n=1 Tax=Deinococcus arenicola TaxID=2994950 RepID=A0ABU4DPK0_9DEIO|nr:hypothetical protein [Deinococcus sp. ZS9-10]MDV6374039.1 hypothetical protein [Deinococcus sp. ZS9-10]
MNTRFLIPLALGLTAVSASALTVSGVIDGSVTPDTRLGAFAVTPFGQPVQEFASAATTGGRFRLDIATAPPPARAQAVLTPQNVSWPGVIDPVQVSASAQVGELKFFIYRDENGNARHDESEVLREVAPMVGRASLFIPWVSAAVTVRASQGYQVALQPGWNAFVVDVGRTVKVQPLADGSVVIVPIGR